MNLPIDVITLPFWLTKPGFIGAAHGLSMSQACQDDLFQQINDAANDGGLPVVSNWSYLDINRPKESLNILGFVVMARPGPDGIGALCIKPTEIGREVLEKAKVAVYDDGKPKRLSFSYTIFETDGRTATKARATGFYLSGEALARQCKVEDGKIIPVPEPVKKVGSAIQEVYKEEVCGRPAGECPKCKAPMQEHFIHEVAEVMVCSKCFAIFVDDPDGRTEMVAKSKLDDMEALANRLGEERDQMLRVGAATAELLRGQRDTALAEADRLKILIEKSGLEEVKATTVDYSSGKPQVVAAGMMLSPKGEVERFRRETETLQKLASAMRKIAVLEQDAGKNP